MTDPAVWRDLGSDFHQLASKYGDRLTPTWRSTPYNDDEHWHVFRPDTDDADRERDLFLSLAKRAGVLLGRGGQINAVFAWLDHLRFKRTYSIGVRCEGDVGEFEVVKIESPCQASVHCCHDLETDAMSRHSSRTSTAGATSEKSPELENEVVRNPKVPSASLSRRDAQVHTIIGEQAFRTLTNAEIMKTRGWGRRLRDECRLGTDDAAKSCLDRIRRAYAYPLSRDVSKKRSEQS